MLAAPAGSTPTIRVAGCRARSHVDMPAASPPPPIGTTTTSGARPSWRTASTATVPWPAMVRGWSKGGTRTQPVADASVAAAIWASS